MSRYLVRRILQGILTLFLAVLLLHLLTTLAIQVNGNPARAFFGDHVPSKTQLAAVEKRYGLDDPCFDQTGNPCLGPFVHRLGDYLHGDFGTDLHDRSVTDIVSTAAPNTLRLFAVVTVTWFVLGMLLGSVAARYRGKVADGGIRGASILIDALPVFVIMLIWKYIVTVPVYTSLRDKLGADSFWATLFKPSFDRTHPWATVIMPGILLGLAGSASFIRLVRAAQLENYGADHVRTARAKGLAERHVIVHHIVRNSAIPVVTAVGFVFTDALGGAVVTEGVMNIYGMGGTLWRAVQTNDVGVVMGVVTLLTVLTVVVMLVVDLLYAALDPRIRFD